MTVTKEQIQEVLARLQASSYFNYYGDNAAELLNNTKITHDNHTFYPNIREDGKIEIILENGVKGLYDLRIVTAPALHGIDNLAVEYMLLNNNNLDEEYQLYFHEISPFVRSLFQWSAVFIFFARMQPETVEQISNELLKLKKK